MYCNEAGYFLDAIGRNVEHLPEKAYDIPAGYLGWLTLYYRKNGLDIKTLRAAVLQRLPELYRKVDFTTLERIYTCLLKHELVTRELGIANDNSPEPAADHGRLLSFYDRHSFKEGWFVTWNAPRCGPFKPPSPLSYFTNKYARPFSGFGLANLQTIIMKASPTLPV